ncbi:hypothetical protein ABXN37_11700 [Piscinibacter sakaiensis]|uniref:hypothetical protein n=1 Tax=Piscinibacter sakaiensis TaxID=1547922 RepID=UPI00372C14E5
MLTYYRRHPQRARTRLLDLLGEVLTPPPASPPAPAPGPAAPSARRGTPAAPGALSPAPSDDPNALWDRMRAGIAPLKKKR